MDVGISQAFLGPKCMALLDEGGDLYTCGYGGSMMNGAGQLGHGDGESHLTPKLVESLVEDGCFAEQVHLGKEHMAVLTTEGEVLTAGSGSYGRLGNFETRDQLYLEPVELLVTGVIQIAGGKNFTLALKKDGLMQGWGRNDKGQVRACSLACVHVLDFVF
jgi:alpha-tubulin suppressor-like RCC1 family protein